MTVNFKLDYVLNLHNKHSYINAINRGEDDEIAYNRSLIQINRVDIKSITKMSDGTATIIMKNNKQTLETVENYTEILDIIQNANLALDIMKQNKVYIFDNFVVDDDELNVVHNWKPLANK